jgi:hypothetical protein
MAPRFDIAKQVAKLGADSLLPPGPELAIGQIWHENDPRIDRNVCIRAVGPDWVRISTVMPDGRTILNRKTNASRDRFGGTARGKYSFVR